MKEEMRMELQLLPGRLSVCSLPPDAPAALPADGLCFFARTDEELSLVCAEEAVPETALAWEDGWRAMRVAGSLDFSLTGILARLAGALAEAGIPIFAVSTFRTDYLLIRETAAEAAVKALREAGCTVAPSP